MKIIILTAGKGERMWPLTKNTPKSLLEIGGGMNVLETQLKSIKECGIKDVVLVCGYLTEQIEAKVKAYRDDFNIKVIYNPFYDVSNNFVSMWMARNEMLDDDFIVVNGDDVFKPSVLKGLLEHDGKSEICMVVDKKDRYLQDDMKVVMDGDRVLEVSKQIPIDKANGESIGMIRFSGKGKQKLLQTMDSMIREKESLKLFWLHCMQAIMDDGFPVRYHLIDEGDWAEIDVHPDLKALKDDAASLGIFDGEELEKK